MSDNLNWKLAAAVSLGCVSGIVINRLLSSSPSESTATPKNWVRVGKIGRITLYPVKSCAGIDVPQAYTTILGLKVSEYLRDRVFIVVDSRGVFQTQRTVPRLALINVSVDGDRVTLNAPGKVALTFKVPEDTPKNRRNDCRVFADHLDIVLDCGDEVGKWLDSFLELQGLRIYYHNVKDRTQREMTGLQKKFPHFVPTDKGAFSDQTSYMFMTEKSVEELNKNLDDPVTYKNFRPSIMIKDTQEAWDEDKWNFLRIGGPNGPVFKVAKPCTRCKLTTVNPEKGEFREDGEPLKTLGKLKRKFTNDRVEDLVKREAVMGVQYGLFGNFQESLKIEAGDPVYVAAI